MPNTKPIRGARWHSLAACLVMVISVALAAGACDDDDKLIRDNGSASDGGVDGGPARNVDAGFGGGVDAGLCAQKQASFLSFLSAHDSCAVDADCTIIGDCCPHADFPVVQSSASQEARQLQLGLCAGACDGPTYNAVCRQGKCEREQKRAEQWCGAPRRAEDGGTADAGR